MRKIGLLFKGLLAGTIAGAGLIAVSNVKKLQKDDISEEKQDDDCKEDKILTCEEIEEIVENGHLNVMRIHRIPSGVLLYAEDNERNNETSCKVCGKVVLALNGTDVTKITKYRLKNRNVTDLDIQNVKMPIEYGLSKAVVDLSEMLPNCSFDLMQINDKIEKIVKSIRNDRLIDFTSKRRIGYDVSVDVCKKECVVKFFEVGHAGEDDVIVIMTYNVNESNEVLIQTLKLQFPLTDTAIDFAGDIDSSIYDVLNERVIPVVNDYFECCSLDNTNALSIEATFFYILNNSKNSDNNEIRVNTAMPDISKLFKSDSASPVVEKSLITKVTFGEISYDLATYFHEWISVLNKAEGKTENEQEQDDNKKEKVGKDKKCIAYKIKRYVIAGNTQMLFLQLIDSQSQKVLYESNLIFDENGDLYSYINKSKSRSINIKEEDLVIASKELKEEFRGNNSLQAFCREILESVEKQLHEIYDIVIDKEFDRESMLNSYLTCIKNIRCFAEAHKNIEEKKDENMESKRPVIKPTLEVEYHIHKRIIDETPCIVVELMNNYSKKPLFDIRFIFDNKGNLYAYKKTSYHKGTIDFANEELTLATPELSAEMSIDNSIRALYENFLKEAEEQLHAKYTVDFGNSIKKSKFYREFKNMLTYLASRNKNNDVFGQIATEVNDNAIYLHACYHPALFKIVFKLDNDGIFMKECEIYKKDVYWKIDEEFHVIFDNILHQYSENTVWSFDEAIYFAFSKIIGYTSEEVIYGKININPYMISLR